MKDYKTVFVNTDGVNFPDTAGVNASGGGATDGTEFVKLFVDDLWGAAQAIMDFAGFTPSGVDESATVSQRLQAILKFIKPIVIDVTGDITLSDERPNQLIKAVKQAGDITITLPDASAGNFINQTIMIKVSGTAAGGVLYVGNGGQTIDGLPAAVWNHTVPGIFVIVSDGSNWQVIHRADNFLIGLLYIRDEKAQNTGGGTFTSGAWRIRDLNTVKTNEIVGASLAANQITLPAGTYDIEWSAPGNACDLHQSKLYDITNTADLIVGTCENVTDTDVNTCSKGRGRIILAGIVVIELQHRCVNDGTFGNACNFTTEVYSDIRIQKIS